MTIKIGDLQWIKWYPKYWPDILFYQWCWGTKTNYCVYAVCAACLNASSLLIFLNLLTYQDVLKQTRQRSSCQRRELRSLWARHTQEISSMQQKQEDEQNQLLRLELADSKYFTTHSYSGKPAPAQLLRHKEQPAVEVWLGSGPAIRVENCQWIQTRKK